jgi:mono/diheme cytochrome c family protein
MIPASALARLDASQTQDARTVYPVDMTKAHRFAAALALVAGTASGQDVSQGALLYETHCVMCHREGLHDRKASKVKTYADLRVEVERWTRQTGRAFTRDEVEDLIDFLDRSHYRLDLRKPSARP